MYISVIFIVVTPYFDNNLYVYDEKSEFEFPVIDPLEAFSLFSVI